MAGEDNFFRPHVPLPRVRAVCPSTERTGVRSYIISSAISPSETLMDETEPVLSSFTAPPAAKGKGTVLSNSAAVPAAAPLCFPFEFSLSSERQMFPDFAISFSGAVFAKEGEDLPLFHVKGHILYPPDAAVFLAQFFHIKQKNPPSAHYMRAGRGLDAESAAGSPA